MKRNYGSFRIRLPRYRRVPTANGFTTVQEPDGEHTVLIDIDLERLAQEMGARAVKSKSGKAQLKGGIVTVTEKRR